MTLKINRCVLIWTIIIYFFVFQRALIGVSEVFNYADELFAIGVGITILIRMLMGRLQLTKEELVILVLLFLTCIIGLVGNINSGLLTNPVYIIVDVISTVKVWLAYYAILLTNWDKSLYDQLIQILAKCGRILVWIMFFFMFVSQIVDIGMTASARYGIKSFQFVYNVPGNFSKVFYFLIPVLTADINYKASTYKKVTIVGALIVWASTMRSRAFAFIAVFVIMAIFFFYANGRKWGNTIKREIKIIYILPIALIAIAICWNQLVFYFTTDTQARSVLLRYGILTMMTYFPFGAGFGTFGSDVAATQYSPLYVQYGFNSIYGMRQGEGSFLNDNYWPMIMGQFGFWGTMLVLLALIKFMKTVIDATKKNKYFYFSTFCAVGFLLLSSVASKSYSEFSSICIFMLIGVFVKASRATSIEGNVMNEKEKYQS